MWIWDIYIYFKVVLYERKKKKKYKTESLSRKLKRKNLGGKRTRIINDGKRHVKKLNRMMYDIGWDGMGLHCTFNLKTSMSFSIAQTEQQMFDVSSLTN